jgi:hypothetical protein
MFRALSCSSSGGQIILIQHLVSSLSLGDRPVHRLRESNKLIIKQRICASSSSFAEIRLVFTVIGVIAILYIEWD